MSALEVNNIQQKIKNELLKLDIPLVNEEGGIRELESWAEDAVLLETDVSLSQQEKETKYLELKKDLEVNRQLSKEQQKISNLEEQIKIHEKLRKNQKELEKKLKETLQEEKNKVNRLENSNDSLKTQVGLLETYNSEKRTNQTKNQEEIKNNSNEQKSSQNSFVNYPKDSEQVDSKADKKLDDRQKNSFLKSEEEKLVSELKKIREDRQQLQKQLELVQQQQLNFSKEIGELRENINQNTKEDKQVVWLIVIIFTVILGNLVIIFGLRKFLKKSKFN